MLQAKSLFRFFANDRPSWILLGLCAVLLIYAPRVGFKGDRPIRISRETTFLTEPLGPDGYVDYRAALENAASRGVTPDNNAAVLIWQAVGPSTVVRHHESEYFKLLKIDPPPVSGPYFRPVSAFRIKPLPPNLSPGQPDPNNPQWQLYKASSRPWSKQEFPAVAAWLKANSASLQQARKASLRSQYFSPLGFAADGMPDDGLFFAPTPLTDALVNLQYLVLADAMLDVDEGRLDDAWDDALTCRRLARLITSGKVPVDYRVGQWFAEGSVEIDLAILGSDRLTAEQLRRFNRQFSDWPQLPGCGAAIQSGRLMFLADWVTFARFNRAPPMIDISLAKMRVWNPDTHVDWNAALRLTNSWFDRVEKAVAISSPIDRRRAMAALSAEMQEANRAITDVPYNPFANPDSAASRLSVNMLATTIFPNLATFTDAEDEYLERVDMCRLAFALAEYRMDRGQYPATLAALAPHYIKSIPQDRFSGAEFQYRLEADRFMLFDTDPTYKRFWSFDDGGEVFTGRRQGIQLLTKQHKPVR